MAKTVLITGASRGMGAAAALLFGKKGYNVAVNFNSSEKEALNIAEQINAGGGSASVFKADVSNYEDVTKMAESIHDKYGDIDVLVNNAGISEQILFTDITPAIWQKMINVNLNSVYNCCNIFLPEMIRRKKGKIINISSMWGEIGGSCEVHYSAAKAGVIGLTKALAKETAPSGITVNCITPGVIMTDMMKDFDDNTITMLKEETPLGMLGTPDDVANAVLFLADDKSGFITGQVLGVNGGMVI